MNWERPRKRRTLRVVLSELPEVVKNIIKEFIWETACSIIEKSPRCLTEKICTCSKLSCKMEMHTFGGAKIDLDWLGWISVEQDPHVYQFRVDVGDLWRKPIT
jgi:hypothetical protein